MSAFQIVLFIVIFLGTLGELTGVHGLTACAFVFAVLLPNCSRKKE